MATGQLPIVLAIDLGTSGAKAALIDARGTVLGWDKQPTGLILPPGGGAEQDPHDWWAAIVRAVRGLMALDLAAPRDISAACCTAQWSGTVPVSRAGQPLGNAIIWMDARGQRYVRAITGGWPSIDGYGVARLLTWLRLTGGVPTHSGKDSIAHILYLQHQRPQVYQAADQLLEPKDYLNLRLTGKAAASYDSITMHWLTDNRRIDHIDYDDRLLRLAGIEQAKLPPLKKAVDVLGPLQAEAADALGLRAGVPVVMGCPDLHSAALGSGAVDNYAAHLYLGTSSWLSCHVPFMKTDLLHNMASLPSAIPGRYLIVDEQECAGVCLTYLRDNLLFAPDELTTGPVPDPVEPAFDRLAASAPAGSDGLLFMPWLNGERTPVDDHRVRGGFANQSLRTTRAHLLRAVYEGVAYNTRWLFGYVEGFAGRRLDQIHVIGGGAQSDIWCQIHADVLDRTICQVKDPILANLRGAAFLALVALGEMGFQDIPAQVPIARGYDPQPANRRVYDALYHEFVQLYERTRPIYARLNRTAATG